MQSLGLFPGPGHHDAAAYGVSADGFVIVGTSDKGPFRWTAASGLQTIGVLPGTGGSAARRVSADGSVIVGNSVDQAFRWTEVGGMKGLGFLPGGNTSSALDVSAGGSVVVGFSSTSKFDHAFRWTASGGMQDLGFLPVSYRSEAHGVSPDGNVVVGLSGGTGDMAFVWDGTAGQMYDLKALLLAQGMDLNGWSLRDANAVSGDATFGYNVVGWGFDPRGAPEAFRVTGLRFQVAPVPSPSTFVLAALAAVVVGNFRCRPWRRAALGEKT
jgi:probable HAF family extracellular repeat protein